MSSEPFSLRRAVSQGLRFFCFVSSQFPGIYGLIMLSVIALLMEYMATSLMIPLAAPNRIDALAVRFWTFVSDRLGVEPYFRFWVWLFFVLMAARLCLSFIQAVATTILGKRIHRFFSDRVFRHVVGEESLITIHKRSIGHYVTLAGDDTFRCGTIIANLMQVCVGMLTALVAMVVLYQFSRTYFIGIVCFLLVCALIIAFFSKSLVRLTVASNQLSRDLNTAFIESINSIRSIRAMSGEELTVVRYGEQITLYVRQLVIIDAIKVGMRSCPAFVLLLAGAWLSRPGSEMAFEEADLFAATVIIIRVFAALGQVASSGMLLMPELRALHDIDAIVSLTKESLEYSRPEEKRQTQRIESIELYDIHFAYSKKKPIFNGISFIFEKGQTYAVVGPSGSGKSTLSDLLLGLVEPQSGYFMVNGVKAHPQTFRDRILLVEQQPRIFSTTLRDNLLFGVCLSDEVLWDALALVELADFVRSMPDGLDTKMSYQGENFSGGQRQRVGIARALLRHPDVLILDEATSALDNLTRDLVLAKVIDRMQDGILLLVTHDQEISSRAGALIDLGQPLKHG